MKLRRFSKSFRPRYRGLKSGEECCLKYHYLGVLHEVINWLDLWAKNDPERFVECSVEGLAEYCTKFQRRGISFSKSAVEKALHEFRARHIISGRLWRVRDGHEVEGFIVAPHDCLCVRESDTTCVLKGQLHVAGLWQRDLVCDEKGNWTGKLGPVHWAGYGSCVAKCTDESTVKCTVKCTVADSGQHSDSTNVECKKRALNGINGQSSKTVKTDESETSSDSQVNIEGQKSNGKSQPDSSTSFDATDQKQIETVAGRFAEWPDNYRDVLVLISSGRIKDDKGNSDISAVANGSRFHYWQELAECCRAVVQQRGTEPYLGQKTNGDLMAGAMVLFTERHGIKVPPNWYAIAKSLRQNPAERNYKESDEYDWEEYERDQARLIEGLKNES